MTERPKKKKPSKIRADAVKAGWCSGLEQVVGEQLDAAGIAYEYEGVTIRYVPLKLERKYTPDFPLANGIVVETKGRFVTGDRQKIKAIIAQYPTLDLRIVFSNSKSRISKTSKTTYATWCESLGIQYADKLIPAAWLAEHTNLASLIVINSLKEKK